MGAAIGETLQLGGNDSLALARRFFDLFERGEVESWLEMLHPHARFVPMFGAGEVYEGPGGARTFLRAAGEAGLRIEPHAYRFTDHGDRVVAIGSLRQRRFSQLSERTVAWVIRFHEGRVFSLEVFVTPDAAYEAAGVDPLP